MAIAPVAPPASQSAYNAAVAQGASPDVAAAIVRAAADAGVDPFLAVATVKQESGFNPRAVGDNGCSKGLAQLNTCGGEGVGMTDAQLFDPYTNVRRALAQVAAVARQNPGWSPGRIAAAAQRPANQTAYASAVDRIYATLLGVIPGATGGAGGTSSINAQLISTGSKKSDPLGNPAGAASDVWHMLFGGGGGKSKDSTPQIVKDARAAARDAIQMVIGAALIYAGGYLLIADLRGSPAPAAMRGVFSGPGRARANAEVNDARAAGLFDAPRRPAFTEAQEDPAFAARVAERRRAQRSAERVQRAARKARMAS